MVNNLYVVTPRGFCAGVEMAIKAPYMDAKNL